MHMHEARHVGDLLSMVFATKGYAVREGPMGGLLAQSAAETLLIEWADSPVSPDHMVQLAAAVKASGATRGVVVASVGARPAAVTEGTRLGIETWALPRAALEVGMALLEGATLPAAPAPASAPAPVPVPAASPPSAAPPRTESLLQTAARAAAPATGAVFLPSKPREVAPAKALPSAWDIASGSARVPSHAYEMKSRPRAPTVIVEDAPKAKPKDEDAVLVGGSKVKKQKASAPTLPEGVALRIHVAPEAAVARAGVGRALAAKLTLVPHVAFDYDCKVESEHLAEPLVAKGTVLVNTLNGQLRDVAILEFAEAPKEAERVAQRLQAIDVYDRVKAHLLKMTTREVKIEKDVGGVTMMGTEKIGPSMDQLGMEHRGIVSVPVWHVTGESGTADVDATTGDVVPAK